MRRARLFLGGALRLMAWARRMPGQSAMLSAALAGIAFIAIPSTLEIAPKLVWNASASAPLGLYWVGGKSALERGDLVLAALPEPVRTLASERGYLPLGIPLVKPVAALPGDHLCTIGRAILINGKVIARRRKRDSRGRIMLAWSGCRRLTDSEILLLNGDVPDSFDGRYFGPARMDEVVGRLVPLWTWPGPQR
jgi:conjugative transfer signal peptidase TraF